MFCFSKESFSKKLLKVADLQWYFEILQKGKHIFSLYNLSENNLVCQKTQLKHC